ncbi:hypothetical protein [Pseudomonas aeruginosa]|uniref:hypothetical protein n=1 Tax=Pseudomonas aeruginosa TaxID=287 RepID=UPI00102431C2|nr:hypothetical protein [Pseudomonas aeruginosa]QGK89869.1 hypothetical protein [Pseudomonas phage vB_PA32_GUMS]QOV08087.1 hypothetical protein [Pseudomonas phage vB_PaeM_kmuB]UNI71639.1 hypothetical protein Churi01_gp119 [Pseudomonas phage Churi01]UXD83459.1 hypothetical protein NP274_00052 [Pseudomonas phage Koomba boorn-mokiny kep-wari Wadjak 2]WAX23412.1 hypothetical protein [Pseudomonas phage pPA-N1803-4At.2]WNV50231.1 hypothetical protein [Pseudomonas phage PhiPizzaParty]BBI55703.1 pha
MVITHQTVDQIDTQVSLGLPIGYYGANDDLSTLIRTIGDWNIRPIEERRTPGTGYIVAVPSNTRTRVIYTAGRKRWLEALDFSPELAEKYIRACSAIKRCWDHDVATFVLTHNKISDELLKELMSVENPKAVLNHYKIPVKISRNRIIAACQIIFNIRGLKV